MRTVKITWTIEVDGYVSLDIPDHSMTRSQIDDAVSAAIDDKYPEYADEFPDDVEWLGERPKPKEAQVPPPPEFWFETAIGMAVSNGVILLTEPLPAHPDFVEDESYWREMTRAELSSLEKILAVDCSIMRSHDGWFAGKYHSLTEIPDLRVVGAGPTEPGYLLRGEALCGLLMPLSERGGTPHGAFKFLEVSHEKGLRKKEGISDREVPSPTQLAQKLDD